MYDLLTTTELTVLQSMLFEGTEEACRTAALKGDDPDWVEQYRPTHREIAHLFIEAGTELIRRLDQQLKAALITPTISRNETGCHGFSSRVRDDQAIRI